MQALVSLLQYAVIAVGLAWLVALLATPRKTALHLVWGVFCGSLCLLMVKTAFGPALGDYRYLVGMGACATCNVFWLVSRALFHPAPAIQARHVLFAAAVAAPIVLDQLLRLISARDLIGEPLYVIASGSLAGWLQLLSSAVLLLAFWECARSWRADLPAAERRLRLRFLLTYATCVLACTLWTSPSEDPRSALMQIEPLLVAASALAILLVAGHAVLFRSRHPLPAGDPSPDVVRSADQDDLLLARRIEACMRERALFLEPELKVADLAAALATPEYRVSRAITLGLAQPNFNRFINGYRIEHAKRLLADPALRSRSILTIGIDSGFASIGPFNRAFKASTGQTPSAFRSAALGEAAAAAT